MSKDNNPSYCVRLRVKVRIGDEYYDLTRTINLPFAPHTNMLLSALSEPPVAPEAQMMYCSDVCWNYLEERFVVTDNVLREYDDLSALRRYYGAGWMMVSGQRHIRKEGE